MSSMLTRFVTTALLLTSISETAHTQNSGRTLDTSRARPRSSAAAAAADSASGHNWFVSLLRKISRKSDEMGADSLGVAGSADSIPDASDVVATEAATNVRSFKSKKDSVSWEAARATALKSDGYRVIVDIFGKQLYVVDGNDTLRTAPVATAMNASLEFNGRAWRFETPRGTRVVRSKEKDPVWTPPEWHFAEIASEHNLHLKQLERGQVIKLKSGTRLLTRGDEVGIIQPGSTEFEPMVLDEHIVFDNTLFIPPEGTKNRQIQGELGHFRLDMGNGYLLHGTPYAKSIGSAVTHGCVRLRDPDIEWLYENVPVGTKVFLF